MIKLVITDVEGVLTPSEGSNKPWHLNDLLRIRRFVAKQRRNIVCILCTGRQSSYGEALIQALDFFFPFPTRKSKKIINNWKTYLLSWPSIFENGTCFYDPLAKKVIINPVLTKVQLNDLKKINQKIIPVLINKSGCYLESGKMFSISLNPPFKKGSKSRRISTKEFLPIVEEFMQDYLDNIEIKRSLSAIDITPKGISKASAVCFLIKNIYIKPEEILGIGDTSTDEEWMNLVGWSAAPENGRGKLKKVDYFSPFKVSTGFLDILNNLKNHGFEKVSNNYYNQTMPNLTST